MKHLSIFMAALFSFFFAQAQNMPRVDSLNGVIARNVHDTIRAGTLSELAREYRNADPARAISYLEEAITLARKADNKRLEAGFHNNMGHIYWVKPDFKTAIQCYRRSLALYEVVGTKAERAKLHVNVAVAHEKLGEYDASIDEYKIALVLREELKDRKEVGNCLNYLANDYYRKGDYPVAFQYYVQALRVREELNDKIGVANCFIGMGIVLKQQQDLKQSLEYYRRGLKVYEEIRDDNGIGMALNNIGTIQSSLKDYTGALATHLQALRIRERINDRSGIAFSLYNIGNCYLLLGKYPDALRYHQMSLDQRVQLKDKLDISNSWYEMGETRQKMGKLDEALDAYNKSLSIAREIGYEEGIRTAYHGLSSVYKEKKDVSKAFEYYKLFTAEKDSTLNVSNQRIISELQTKYETEKKEQQIALLSKEKAIQVLELKEKELEIRNSRMIQYGLLTAIMAFGLLGYLLYNRVKLKREAEHERQKAELKREQMDAVITAQENERRRFAQELHDGIGSMMAVLKMNISLLEGDVKPEKLPVYNQALTLVDETYHELRNTSHNLMPQALINRGLTEALHDFKDRVNKSGNLHVILDAFAADERLPSEVEVALYRVVQEIVTNIIKYAGAQNANIQMVNHDRYMSLVIEDDGNGFDPKIIELSKGNGWHNIRSRLDLIKAHIDIDSTPQRKGTTIVIDVPRAA